MKEKLRLFDSKQIFCRPEPIKFGAKLFLLLSGVGRKIIFCWSVDE